LGLCFSFFTVMFSNLYNVAIGLSVNTIQVDLKCKYGEILNSL
jgi:hypothetical protein